MALVSRDAFAREELHRQPVHDNTWAGCDWCGGTNARGELYVYRIETEGGRTLPVSGRFCGEDCRKAYHS